MYIKNTEKNRIAIVETIRGIAALAVCMFHFTKGNMTFSSSSELFVLFSSKGWLGVEAFFVLSGFIIPYSLVKSKYKFFNFFNFFAKRCIRIEPPYLISILLVVFLAFLSSKIPGFKGDPFTFDIYQTLAHIAYMPEHLGYKWLLPVYWTLEAEFHFYILIGLALPLLWKNQNNLLFGFAIGLALSFFIPLYVFSFMPLFVMGISVAAYKTNLLNQRQLWIVLLSCVMISLVRGIPYLVPTIGILTSYLICYVEYQNKMSAFLGKISYSLYLIHVPIGGRIINYGGRYANTSWKVWLVLLLALIITLLASWFFYKLVEYPSQLLSKKITYKKIETSSDHIASLPTS